MLIRNIDFTDDPQGLPATGFQFYIGLPNTNPQEHANRLQVFNRKDGEEVSNPFFVDQLGRFINGGNSSTVIKPWVNEQEYSILVLSPEGGVWREYPQVTSDFYVDSTGETTLIFSNYEDFQIDNLDASGVDTVYFESTLSGWEDTVPGPLNGAFYHKDGTNGTPNTSTPALPEKPTQFYDNLGNGYTINNQQRIGDQDIGPDQISSSIAGGGLSGGDGAALEVNVDNVTTEISSDTVIVKDGGISEAQLADDSVSTDKIQDEAVTTDKIDDDAITSDKLATDSVDSNAIASNAVGSTEIAPDAVGSTEIAPDAVGSSEIASGAVGSNEINTSIAGDGLSGGSGDALEVNVDGDTIEIDGDVLKTANQGNTRSQWFGVVVTAAAPDFYIAGSPFPSGWSVTGIDSANFKVIHNLGSTSYAVQGEYFGSSNNTANVTARFENDFDVRVFNTTNGNNDIGPVFFTLNSE